LVLRGEDTGWGLVENTAEFSRVFSVCVYNEQMWPKESEIASQKKWEKNRLSQYLSGVAYANLVAGTQKWVLKALANRDCWRRHLSKGEKGNGPEDLGSCWAGGCP